MAVRTYDGTATAGTDYTAVDTTVTFVPGQTIATTNIAILNDTSPEPDETVNVILGPEVTGAQLSTPNTAILSIVDDDTSSALPSVSLSTPEGVTEGNSVAFAVTLPAPSTLAVSADYTTANGSAVAPDDYTATSGTLTIPAGSTSATVSVPTADDSVHEATETFTLNLSNPRNATVAKATGTATIVDNEAVPSLSVDSPAPVAEGGAVVFTVSLSGPDAQAVSVDFATGNGSAVAPDDYTATSGSLTIPAGSTSATVSVATVDDGAVEDTESFTLTLTNPNNATVANGSGTSTIVDNDTLVVSVNNPATVTEGEPVVFTVSLSTPTNGDISVLYDTGDGTAANGEDYFGASGVVDIPAGSTSARVSVATIDDPDPEGTETFSLNVHLDTTSASGTGRIRDNDFVPCLTTCP